MIRLLVGAIDFRTGRLLRWAWPNHDEFSPAGSTKKQKSEAQEGFDMLLVM